MKVFLLLCLAGLAVADYGFTDKKEYIYDYETKLVTAIPGITNQGSGLAFKAQLIIQTTTHDSYTCQIKQPQIHEFMNTEVPLPWDYHPVSDWKPVPKYAQELEKTFTVSVHFGKVHQLQVANDEPEWVTNIKKGVVSIIQVNMKQQTSLKDTMVNRLQATSSIPDVYYHVMEEGISGECQTIYEVTPVPSYLKARELKKLKNPQLVDANANLFKVIKTKNFENCRTRPIYQHLTPPSQYCATGWKDCKGYAANRTAVAEYLLSGDVSDFRIHRCENTGMMLIFPYGHQTEPLWSYSNQTLNLVSVNAISHPLSPPSSKVSFSSLIFIYPRVNKTASPSGSSYPFAQPDLTSAPEFSFVLPGSPTQEFRQAVPFSTVKSQIRQIVQSITQTFSSIPDPDKTDVPSRVLALERAFSMLSFAQIQEVYQQFQGQGNEVESQRQIFLDALVITGTNPAVMYVKYEIQHGNYSAEYVSSLLSVLPMHIKTPTKPLLEELYQMRSFPAITKYQQTRISLAMAFGNLLYEACVNPRTRQQSFPITIYHAFCDETDSNVNGKYIDYFVQAAESAQDVYEKAAYLQALGNVATKTIISRLVPFMTHEKSQDPVLRSQAVYALYRVLERYPEEVIEAVAPLYHNLAEEERVRAAAVSIIIACDPSLPYLERIAVSTWEEPSQQIVSYIYTTFQSLANLTDADMPQYFNLSRKARMVLPTVRAPDDGYSYSHHFFYTDVIRYWQRGTGFQAAWFGHENSTLPMSSYASLISYVNGFMYTPIRAAMEISNPQSILDLLMSPEKDEVVRRNPRDLKQLGGELAQISQKLNIKSQFGDYEEPRAKIYVQLLGVIDRMFFLENVTLSSIQTKLQDVHTLTNVQKAVNLYDITMSFPSEFGLAVTYSVKTPLVASVKGDISFSYSGWKAASIKIGSVKPYVYGKMLSTLGFVNPFDLRYFAAGADNHFMSSLPLQGHINYNIAERRFDAQISLQAGSQPKTVVAHLETVPFTTCKAITQFTPLSESPDTKIVHFREAEHNVYKFGQDWVGFDLSYDELSEYPFNDAASYYNIFKQSGYATSIDSWAMMSSLKRHRYQVLYDPHSSASTSVYFSFAYDTNKPPSQRPSQKDALEKERDISRQRLQSIASQIHGGEGFTVSVVAGLSGKIQRNASMSAVYVSDHDSLHNKYDVQYECVNCNDPTYKHFCVKADIQYPAAALSEDRQHILSSDLTTPAKVDVCWGRDCQSDRQIHITGQFERSQQSVQTSRNTDAAKKCQQDETEGYKFTPSCFKAKLQAAMYDKAHLVAKYSNLSPYFKNVTRKADDLLKYFFFQYISNDNYNIQNPASQVVIDSHCDYQKMSVDFLVKKPQENTWFHQLRLPDIYTSSPWPFSARTSLKKIVKDKIFGSNKDTCVLEASETVTFDNVKIPTELSSCYHLLAKDCTERTRIAILAKKEHESMKKSVKILVDDDKIELKPQGDQVKVKVNGHEIPVSSQPRVVSSSQPSLIKSGGDVKASIKKRGKSVVVSIPQHSAEVISDGSSIQIKMSPLLYRNKVCGLCGDMNGEKTLELKDPEKCIKEDPESFVMSYAVPDSSCHLPPTPSPPQACVKVVKSQKSSRGL